MIEHFFTAPFITSLNQPALWAEPIGQCIST